MKRIIYHVDVNNAFLSWEAVYRLEVLGEEEDLRKLPSAVGGSVAKRHGIILAKSMVAKQEGVKTADTISEALKKCPQLILVPPRYDLYKVSSKKFINILKEYTPALEQYSIDEAYMDMTGMQEFFGSPVVAAHMIKDRIFKDLGFSVNIGISSNKVLAKMASELQKPNKVNTLFEDEITKKLWPLPIEDLFFCGRSTSKKLRKIGISTVGELAKMDLEILKLHLKSHGEVIWNYANGRDLSGVKTTHQPNKGYGNSITVPFDVIDHEMAGVVLLSLCEKVAYRLRKNKVRAVVISVTLKYYTLESYQHQCTLFSPTNITNELFESSLKLFQHLWDGMTPVRQIGVRVNKITHGDMRQMNLFEYKNHEKLEKLDDVIDQIRNKYGNDSVIRARYAGNVISHMSGGISKDKKKVEGEEVYYE